MRGPYRATITIDADIFAGIPPNYTEEIVEFIHSRLSAPFFVHALSVKVEYPENDDTDSNLAV
jgi:hypothetical protein